MTANLDGHIDAGDLLKMACQFDLGVEPFIVGKFGDSFDLEHVSSNFVKVTKSCNQPERWAIVTGFGALNKLGQIEYQPMNSNRDDNFLERCRYSSCLDAIEYYRRWRAAVIAWGHENQGKVVLEYRNIPEDKLEKF